MANTATEIDWDCAITKKHIEEAEAVGLTLIGVGRNTNYRTYSINKCGHEFENKMGHIRNGVGVKCKICPREKFKIDWDSPNTKKHIKEAKAVGLILLGVGRNTLVRKYRFDNCGHEQEIGLRDVRVNNFKCGKCHQDKLKNEAKTVGLTLIGVGRTFHYRTYRFDNCGHEQEIDTGAVRKKQIRCKKCLQDKHNEEAKAVGLILLGVGRNKLVRKYRFDNCGHEQEIGLRDVRVNNFICNTCEETNRDLPSKVYLLKITVDTVIQSFTWLKLGYAKTVNTRIKQYGLSNDAVIERLKVMDFETGREAHRYEASLHSKYLRKRLPIKKMKEFMSYGFNECYPLEILDTLMKDLEAKEKRMKK